MSDPSRIDTSGGWPSLAVFLAIVAAVLLLGGLFSPNSAGWYRTLERPAFQPPPWAFGVVWPILYLLMAVAAWRVWLRRRWCTALVLWCVQLALNATWSPVFFGLQSLVGGLVVIIVLLATLTATVAAFWSVSRLAGGLLLPYLAWTAYATALNAAVVAMN
jgi:tryptophan-rich sensory protein